MNFVFRIDEVSKFGFRNEIPVLKNEEYVPVSAVISLENTISGEVKNAEFTSFDDYFKEK